MEDYFIIEAAYGLVFLSGFEIDIDKSQSLRKRSKEVNYCESFIEDKDNESNSIEDCFESENLLGLKKSFGLFNPISKEKKTKRRKNPDACQKHKRWKKKCPNDCPMRRIND